MKNIKNIKTKIKSKLILFTIFIAAFAVAIMPANVVKAMADNNLESLTVASNDESKDVIVESIDPNIIVTVTKLDNPVVAQRSYYSSTFDFVGSLYGTYRYFDGNHIGCEISSLSVNPDKDFTIKLIRKGGAYGTCIATATMKQAGDYHVDFWNVYNPNYYRFSFVHPINATGEQYGTINMFSWS